MKRHFLYWLTCVADLVSGFIGTVTFGLLHPSGLQFWAEGRYLDECQRPLFDGDAHEQEDE